MNTNKQSVKHRVIETNDYDARLNALLELAPDIFKLKNKTVLYIGANDTNFSLSTNLHGAEHKISIVELDENACIRLKRDERLVEVINEDIVKFTTNKKYDVIIWWGGPEHIYEKDIEKTLNNLESICTGIIAMMAPWGTSNKNNQHYTSFDIGDFEKYGYDCIYIGEKNCEQCHQASGIVAVKIL